MKVETNPKAAGLAAALIYSAVWAWVIALSSACHEHKVQAPSAPAALVGRTPLQAAQAAVYITVDCGAMLQTGSGVLVSGTQVLTAHHVVNCETYPKLKHGSEVTIEFADGERMTATYEVLDPRRDLVRLRLAKPVAISPVSIVYAKKGALACAVTGTPERAFRCGLVKSLGGEVRRYGDLDTTHTDLWLGNSGSGVYNDDGMLIGIATRIAFCSQLDWDMWNTFGIKPAHVCGGKVSSIVDSPVLP